MTYGMGSLFFLAITINVSSQSFDFCEMYQEIEKIYTTSKMKNKDKYNLRNENNLKLG